MKTKMVTVFITLVLAFLQVNAQNFQSTAKTESKATSAELQKNDANKQLSTQDVLDMKRDYIEENLELTEQEAKLFWDFYDRMEAAEMAIHQKYRKISQGKGISSARNKFDYSSLSDDQILFMMEKKLEMQTEMLELEKQYFNEIKTILPPQKIVKLESLEKKFKREIVKERGSRSDSKK